MNQSSEYLSFILDKFAALEVVTARKMFGGYVLHMAGKVLGFVFDDTFLFEPGPTVDKLLSDAPRQELFPGSKLFVVIDESMSPHRLCELASACYDDFPLPKPRKRKGTDKAAEMKRQKAIEKLYPFSKKINW